MGDTGGSVPDPLAELLRVDPRAVRLREITTETHLIIAAGDIGEPEFRRVEALYAEAQRILDESGVTEQEQRRARDSRYHPGRGRAVDLPPRSALDHFLRANYRQGGGDGG